MRNRLASLIVIKQELNADGSNFVDSPTGHHHLSQHLLNLNNNNRSGSEENNNFPDFKKSERIVTIIVVRVLTWVSGVWRVCLLTRVGGGVFCEGCRNLFD